MVSIAELKLRFGPAHDVAPYGECIVVQGSEFDPDWEAELGDQGVSCHFGDLDGHAVTFVQLKKAVAEGKVVYVPKKPEVPQQLPDAVGSNVKKASNRGDIWTSEDESELLREYDLLVAEGKDFGAYKALAELPRFKARTFESIQVKLKRLKKLRKDGVSKNQVIGEVKETEKAEENEPEKQSATIKKVIQARAKGGNNWQNVWTVPEDNLVISLWKKTPKIAVSEICLEVSKRFPKRTVSAVANRISALQVEGRIQRRLRTKNALKNKKSISNPDPDAPERFIDESKSAEAWKKTVEIPDVKTEVLLPEPAKSESTTLEEVPDWERKFEILSEAYESISKGYLDLRAKVEDSNVDLETKIRNVAASIADLPTKDDLEFLRQDLEDHEHSEKTGKVMVPLKAT